ncbi:MAG: histidine-type phosphatase [Oscillospiraceae bacterium]|nr:histidine-type phosphatase [Oscillospiraceae bacterium]
MKKDTSKTLRGLLIAVSLILVCVLIVQCLFWAGLFRNNAGIPSDTADAVPAGVGSLSREGYELEQVVVLSRHNIRSPLSGSGSALGTITPHEWFAWSSNPSELSLRGGVLETEMGQYFRKWLEAESLFPENYHPTADEVRIYANSKQRTIATAEYFVSGLLPTANTPIETHAEYDTMDPVFHPQLTFVSPAYNTDATAQVWELYGNAVNDLADNYELIADVIDMEQSEAWKDGSATAFVTDDSQLTLELGKEPVVKGSLKTACSVSDALVLQYFEEPDAVKAAFGHELTDEQWQEISEIKDVYGDVLFTAPLIAANVAHPLLQEIEAELTADGRVFTFLCGHDSNVGSVLAALGVEDYELPGAIEKTPIGCKLVFSRWSGPDGGSYCTVDMVYETVDQLRAAPLLDLAQHPAIVPMRFAGIAPNADGMYAEADFINLLRSSIAEYDRIVATYDIANAA